MPSFKIKDDMVLLGSEWVTSAKFNSRDRLVNSKGYSVASAYSGRVYRLIDKREREMTSWERLSRGALGLALVVASFSIALLSKSVRDLFVKSKFTYRFGVLEDTHKKIDLPGARDDLRTGVPNIGEQSTVNNCEIGLAVLLPLPPELQEIIFDQFDLGHLNSLSCLDKSRHACPRLQKMRREKLENKIHTIEAITFRIKGDPIHSLNLVKRSDGTWSKVDHLFACNPQYKDEQGNVFIKSSFISVDWQFLGYTAWTAEWNGLEKTVANLLTIEVPRQIHMLDQLSRYSIGDKFSEEELINCMLPL